METLVDKNPYTLKLAEITHAIELVEEDGGAKGVDEATNFRAILHQIQWLPQYDAVHEEYAAWKKGERTTQQVLAWTEQKIQSGEIDGAWLNKVTAHLDT